MAEAPTHGEARLAARHAGVSLIGFAVDWSVLHLLLRVGLEPAWARVGSLLLAMHATFLINGLHVFGGLERGRGMVRQWAGYMAANGFGNLCNYWIFVTLVSTHWRIVASPVFALTVGSLSAWAINYSGTRWLVFGRTAALARRRAAALARLWRRRVRSGRDRGAAPSPAARGSARR